MGPSEYDFAGTHAYVRFRNVLSDLRQRQHERAKVLLFLRDQSGSCTPGAVGKPGWFPDSTWDTASRLVPQEEQNFRSLMLSLPQVGQNISKPHIGVCSCEIIL